MTSRDFCYWLQGFFEIGAVESMTPGQVDMVKRHLNMVFYHEIDPSYSKDKQHLASLQKIHDGDVKFPPITTPIATLVPADKVEVMPKPFIPHSGGTGNVFPSDESVLLRC